MSGSVVAVPLVDALEPILEAVLAQLVKAHPPEEVRAALDATFAKVARAAASAALDAKFPDDPT